MTNPNPWKDRIAALGFTQQSLARDVLGMHKNTVQKQLGYDVRGPRRPDGYLRAIIMALEIMDEDQRDMLLVSVAAENGTVPSKRSTASDSKELPISDEPSAVEGEPDGDGHQVLPSRKLRRARKVLAD